MPIESLARIEWRIPFPNEGIFGLEKRIAALEGVDAEIAKRILDVRNIWAHTKPPESMFPFIVKQFGSVEAVRNQPIVRVDILPLRTGTLFNGLRSMRPGMSKDAQKDIKVEEIITESLIRDVFADPVSGTPEASWGRVKGRMGISAENVAKFDGEHSLVIFDESHPLKFERSQVVDYLMTAKDVWQKQHENNLSAVYPFLMWQALGKSASSVTHGHLQAVMGEGRHYSKIEGLRQDAKYYEAQHNANFWTDYAYLHDKLGLMIRRNGAVVMAHVAPVKEKEIIMMGQNLDEEFASDTFDLLDCYINRLGVRSFTLSIATPPVGEVSEDWTNFPVLLRLIDRGDPTTPTADMGAMEIYAQSVVASDPYNVKRVLSEHWGEHE